ncbi:Alpha/Beta hydrolase protein [Mycena leptocephala]|nr:Alpha/Beta hydrolase protein [Mycena leptocephala]
MLLPLLQVLALSTFVLLFRGASGAPTVSLPYGSFQGTTSGNVSMFLGVPFAQAARFELPRAPKLLHGVQNATEFGPACPQQLVTPPLNLGTVPLYPSISEDCLTLDVFKPTDSNADSKLPVFVYIYGGGFQIGNSRDINMLPVVERSLKTNEPVIIVAINYRLTAFGFLASFIYLYNDS